MKPEELEKMPLQVEKLFFDLQNRVMEDVVRRIRKTKEITSTADYQIEKMIMMGQNSEFIESEIKHLTEMTDSEIYQLYEDVIDKEYTRNKSIYEQVNAEFIPYEESPEMKAWVSAVTAQTKGEIKNITQSMGFALNYNGKMVFTPFSEYYQKYLDRASLDIITGVFSYDTVLRRTVKEMTASGIRSVDYASGHSNRITVAGRRAVMTGVNQLCSQINLMNAEKLGTDTFEITFHYGARPSHWWGGMIFTKSELESVCGLGRVDGLCGANCRHNFMAFIKDVSVRAYTDEQLAEMNARDKVEREWQGKKYNAYEASQKQRQMETLMRKQRSDVKLLKAGKADQEEIIAAQARYVNTLHQYQAFSKKMNLPEQMERVYMDGLGRIAPSEQAYKKYVREQLEKKQERFLKEVQKKNLSKFSERFQNYNFSSQKDIITTRRVMNDLNKSNIGKDVINYILKHPNLEIQMCYGVDHEQGVDGEQLGDIIRIFASETKTVQRTTEVLIHEITHHRYDIGGNQWSECVCKAQEVKHRKDKDKLTGNELRNIIKEIRKLYPEYSWR